MTVTSFCYLFQSQDELLKILKGIKKEKQNDLGWGALKLLGMLFTAHELATHCYRKPTKSCGKPYLSDTHKDKVDLLEGWFHEYVLTPVHY